MIIVNQLMWNDYKCHKHTNIAGTAFGGNPEKTLSSKQNGDIERFASLLQGYKTYVAK